MATQEAFGSFGMHCFDDRVMRERLPGEVYKSLKKISDEGAEWDASVADVVADVMKDWAIQQGATHYIHWFTPMTGISSGKHDSFISGVNEGQPLIHFSGKLLSKGESDASSFPSGGLRSTFEARGYTTWDPTSPAFVLGTTLYIPTAFCGYTGEALDQKTPVLRSMQALCEQAMRMLRALGDKTTRFVTPTVGAEQEYFLVEKALLDERLDLKVCGYTLAGAKPPKGQELEDHYYGSVSERVRNFMRELDEELWLIGVPAKTEHNEVAPGQYELASVFSDANIALDHNQIIMELLRKVALRHGFACLLHEKPYAGINGSGKHNNWSLLTSEGVNLLKPTSNPVENRPFLVLLCAILAAVDQYADLIRMSAASPGNDLRLGANEAPPSIISVFLGDQLTNLLKSLADGHAYEMGRRNRLSTGVEQLPDVVQDDHDRNRTSPFAFTGNRFEFRMVGSSQSIGLPNTVINAAVADVLRTFADRLEEADSIDATIAQIVHDTWENHRRIIFNGNNYSADWRAEAKRRGLADVTAMVEAAGAFLQEKNIAMFARTGVFSESECRSRHEMMLDAYVKNIRIAVATLLEMTHRSFLPAACAMLSAVAKTHTRVEAAGARCGYADSLTKQLAAAIDSCSNRANALQMRMEELKADLPVAEAAAEMRAVVQNEMAQLRSSCDTLESLVPENRWPVPGYTQLLYDL